WARRPGQRAEGGGSRWQGLRRIARTSRSRSRAASRRRAKPVARAEADREDLPVSVPRSEPKASEAGDGVSATKTGMAFEVWTTGAGVPGLAARHAAAAEAAGYDRLALVDSQNLAGDCYGGRALAAQATRRLRLATGVTNPVTRHPAATAAAIAAVHAESGGRAVLGIGRGDSALAHLGYAPAPVAVFERTLER